MYLKMSKLLLGNHVPLFWDSLSYTGKYMFVCYPELCHQNINAGGYCDGEGIS